MAFRAAPYLNSFLLFLGQYGLFWIARKRERDPDRSSWRIPGSKKYIRSDNNFFAVLRDPVPDKNGDDHEAFSSESDDGFTVVRGKRQIISTGAESNELIGLMDEPPNYDSLTKDLKLHPQE